MPESSIENELDHLKGIRNLIDSGAEIAGGAVGGALGVLAGDPVGAAVLGVGGAAAVTAFKHIGQQASERLLGPREKVRVGGVLAIAVADIRQRIESGEKVRSDRFFEEQPSGRSDAKEVAENVLLKSQREPEEKKLPFMGRLLSNVAFDAQISGQMAHQITKAAEQLTYRQLCILSWRWPSSRSTFGPTITGDRAPSPKRSIRCSMNASTFVIGPS